jgi:hypothetical protein
MEDRNKALALRVIKAIAKELGYEVTAGARDFEITSSLWHSVAFRIFVQQGYIAVSPWEDKGSGSYGRAIYSLRSMEDVMQFCQILICSSSIRAKRRTSNRKK